MKDIAPDITLVGVNIPQINYSQLKMGEEIGKGGWGVVFRASYEGEALWPGQNEKEVFFFSGCCVSVDFEILIFFFLPHFRRCLKLLSNASKTWL